MTSYSVVVLRREPTWVKRGPDWSEVSNLAGLDWQTAYDEAQFTKTDDDVISIGVRDDDTGQITDSEFRGYTAQDEIDWQNAVEVGAEPVQ
jgi:hypothetical protein